MDSKVCLSLCLCALGRVMGPCRKLEGAWLKRLML